jgi:AraC-like DNA-binding protein
MIATWRPRVLNDCDRGIVRAMRFRTTRAGLADIAPGTCLPRHRHLAAYAIVVVHGSFHQVGYAGRLRAIAGDLVVQPALDAHANDMPATRGATIIRLPWPADGEPGAFVLDDVDDVVRAAERDPADAAAAVREQWLRGLARRAPANDIPDALAADLVAGRVDHLAAWSQHTGVARETVARAFRAAFGVSARQFRLETRARLAWLRIAGGNEPLVAIAAATGFADQAHMTRAVRALTGASPRAWRQRKNGSFAWFSFGGGCTPGAAVTG